jgi:hypothetical protein
MVQGEITFGKEKKALGFKLNYTFESMSLAFQTVILNGIIVEMCMHRIMCGLSGFTTFFHIISQRVRF